MNEYHAKTLFTGYKIGLDNPYLYVAVTEKKLDHSCMVIYQGEIEEMHGYMIIEKGTKPLKKLSQAGVGGLPDHTLCYFLWKPYIKKDDTWDFLKSAIMKMSPEQRVELREKLGLKKKSL